MLYILQLENLLYLVIHQTLIGIDKGYLLIIYRLIYQQYFDIKYNLILHYTENSKFLEEFVLAITVNIKSGTLATESPKDIGIVIEGVQVITDLA